MLVVLLSLLLVTSTSIIKNNYHNARRGVDSPDNAGHPLAGGGVPLSIARTFVSALYGVCAGRGIPRHVAWGHDNLYTVHLKPRTWAKNLSCAALIG
jgi:hypothetical protein